MTRRPDAKLDTPRAARTLAMGKLRKRLLWASAAVLVATVVLTGLGRALRGGIRLGGSATGESYLALGTAGVGIVTVSDPSGYAIPFASRWQDVIDLNSYREVASSGVPLVYRGSTVTWTNRQGGIVTIRSWYAWYVMLSAAAALVLVANVGAWGYARARAALAVWQARRFDRRYPAGEHCPACGYDVRESADRCPECGQAFARRTVIVAAAGPTGSNS